ncbi:MAG TPA: ribokinase [Patescibacteria group bacterium]|nr:ribokinase [Patescibacteria group bacterium]
MSIVVFGSINMDLVAHTPRLPSPGETIIGRSFTTVPGGKGANQAVACARLGAAVELVGRLGNDVFGEQLLVHLQAQGVGTRYLSREESISSGVALIEVDDAAENNIIVIPGANGRVGQADLLHLITALSQAKLLLLQLEIPLEVVIAAAHLANERGVKVILDPAPAQELPAEVYPLVDLLTPNETEAASLTGLTIANIDDAVIAACKLLSFGARRVIIKLGNQGALLADEKGVELFPAFPVTAVNTVAAGDAFNGALAVALSKDQPLRTAIRWGLAGGALSVTQFGAQESMPDLGMLQQILFEVG